MDATSSFRTAGSVRRLPALLAAVLLLSGLVAAPAGAAVPSIGAATASRSAEALVARATRKVEVIPSFISCEVNERPTSTAEVPAPRPARTIVSARM